jgi:hypothetical protein
MGYMDTDMTADVDAPKSKPADIASAIFTALEAGADEALTDDVSKQVRASFAAPRAFYLGAPRA